MLRRLYDWTLSLAAKPSAPYALAAVSFAESSFFPVPPDAMLVPMVLARPDRAWFYASVCTAASVAGGFVGYAIGALLYDLLGAWLFKIYGLTEGAEAFRAAYGEYGHWVILLKGLTPIPYKLVTITSGFAGYDLFLFAVLSIVTRGARFFILAALLGRFGPHQGHPRPPLQRGGGGVRDHGDRRFWSVPLPVLERAAMPRVPDTRERSRSTILAGVGRDDRRRARLPVRLRSVAVQALPHAAHPYYAAMPLAALIALAPPRLARAGLVLLAAL